MFEEPSNQDFTSWIEWHLDKRVEVAGRDLAAIQRKHNAEGQWRSGRSILLVLDAVSNVLGDGVDTALGELRRAARVTKLDAPEMRRITETQLRIFLDNLKSLGVVKSLGGFAPPAALRKIDDTFVRLGKELDSRLRQFDVGFLQPEEPERPSIMSNNINIGTMAGGAVQQASKHSPQHVEIQSNISMVSVLEAVSSFEKSLENNALPNEIIEEIKADLQTIKLQMEKTKPNTSMAQEAGRSIRNILEGSVGSSLSGVAGALWKSLFI